MSYFLPQDMLTGILARLPFKTILQCRCVSKTWYSLISRSTFATHHLNKTTKTKNSDILLFRYCSRESNGEIEHYFLYPDEGFPDNHLEELDCPFKSTWAALWNPSIRKTVSIPRPNVTFTSHGSFVHSLGFGFDSISNDYKLVRVVYLQDCSFGFDEVPPMVEVYTMRRGCWGMITNDLKYVIREQSACAFLNGACHWIGYNSLERDEPRHATVAFNLGNEVFVQMTVPDCLVWDDFIDISLTVFDGMLSLVPWIQRLVAFRENNEVLLPGEDGELISYDPNTNNWDCKLFGDENIEGNKNREGPLTVDEEKIVLPADASGDHSIIGIEEASGASRDHEDGADKKNKEIAPLLDGVNEEHASGVWFCMTHCSKLNMSSINGAFFHLVPV
ncbi:F-box protein CPR1-like [Populus nigra]|uniref:F-box protein CPR1-like n=1 Tax=Populus nigra TaxID=3691 RepID=UPI002B266F42|nr:F-box protein CPR1-like [Populus nigra]